MDLAPQYSSSVLALGVFGLFYLVQLLVADIVGFRAKRVPGTTLEGGHGDFVFRANRAHANTTESVGILLLLSLFAMLSGGDPTWTARALWCYVGLRMLHTGLYYLNLPLMRSAIFLLSLAALVGLFGVGIMAP